MKETGRRPTRLTALVTNYNYGRYLTAAVHGIAAQSRRPDEFIVVDDASTDDSARVIADLVRQFPFIKVVQHDVNQGMNATAQQVLNQITGDYLYWGSADDMVLPGFFDRAMELIEKHPQAPLCSGVAVWLRDEGGEQYSTCSGMPGHDAFLTAEQVRALGRRGRLEIRGHTSIYRVADIRRLGGFLPEMKWHSDWFLLNTLGLSAGMCWSARPHAVMRTHSGNYSRSAGEHDDEQREVLRYLSARIMNELAVEEQAGFRESGVLAEHLWPMFSLMVTRSDLWPLWSIAYSRNVVRALAKSMALRLAAATVPTKVRGRIGRWFRHASTLDLTTMKGRGRL